MKAITTNATNLSLSGIELDSPDAKFTIGQLVQNLSKTRNGGQSFNGKVLFKKVCDKVKSLAGNVERLPDETAQFIKTEIASLSKAAQTRLEIEGWEATKLSGIRVNISTKDNNVTRSRSMAYSQDTSLELKIKDTIWTIKQLVYKAKCLEDMPVEDIAKREENETKATALRTKAEKYNQVLNVLKTQQAEIKPTE